MLGTALLQCDDLASSGKDAAKQAGANNPQLTAGVDSKAPGAKLNVDYSNEYDVGPGPPEQE
ncbi:hypothetical protein PG990_012751 [Apiospora arundinis]|uniref:Uncharacterized protein n=1 Tax=Apiospora arundinis TaxID=335852 RepID=A0ABR2HRE5_9PEZI